MEVKPRGSANAGGFIYRDSRFPEFAGKLVFGDFSTWFDAPTGQIFLATPPAVWRGLWAFERLLDIDQRVHSLGQDAQGEVYVLTTAQENPVGKSGKVWTLVRQAA